MTSKETFLFEGQLFTRAELEALNNREGINDARRARIEAKLKEIEGKSTEDG
jgi:hypothetical protein